MAKDYDAVRKKDKNSNDDKDNGAVVTDYTNANIFSLLTFFWVGPLLTLGRSNQLKEKHLELPPNMESSYTCKEFSEHWNREMRQPSPSLKRAIRNCYWPEFLYAAICKAIWSFFLLLSAFYFVRSLVSYVQKRPAAGTWDEKVGYIQAVAFFLSCMILSVALQQMDSRCTRLGNRIRSAVMTTIYRKALRVDGVASQVSDVLSLVTSDCSRLLEATTQIHYLWSGPVEALAIMGLLVYLSGTPALLGFGLMILFIPTLFFTGTRIARVRKSQIELIDRRVRILHEVILAIKLVKFYAWEKSFASTIAQMRDSEAKMLRDSGIIKSFNLMLVFYIPPIMAISIFSLYVLKEGSLPPTIAFTTLSLFNTLRFPLVILPKALKSYVECLSSMKRIEGFLLKTEAIPISKSIDVGLLMKDASFTYGSGPAAVILEGVTFKMEKGQTMALVGPLGGGKSTVLNGILGEAKLIGGNIRVGGSLAYVPQVPWIQHATVRENILFGSVYDEKRYKLVTFACALFLDFQMLPQGDHTEIGERGINLSGGQKQRIALARAVYSDRDVYLLDSPLSAVDQHTSHHIMTHCINGVLRGKIVILITHQLQLLNSFDQIMLVKDGKMLYNGPYTKDFIPKYFPSLVNEITEDIRTEKHEEKLDEKLGGEMQTEFKTTTNDQVGSAQQGQQADAIDLHESSDDSRADPSSSGNSLRAFNLWFKICGHWRYAISVFVVAAAQTIRIVSDWFISRWTADSYNQSQTFYVIVYAILISCFCTSLIIRGLLYYGVMRRGGSKIFNRLFKRIIRAPLSYFTVTPLGRLLNCFSRDQDVMDESLPDVVHLYLIYGCIVLATMILVCITLPYYAVIAVFLIAMFLFFQRYYISSTKHMKTLASSTNGPVFAHVSESLQGIAVLRAFDAQEWFARVNSERLDRNSRAVFNLDHIQLWLAFRLDTIGSLLILATALYCTIFKGTSGSAAGLAISSTIQQLVFFTWVVRGFAESQSLVDSVERLFYYGHTPPQEKEDIIYENRPVEGWPNQGRIAYRDVHMSYFVDSPAVLKGVSFTINPGEKVGVVGRTGSGKSSLIMAMFRMCELAKGIIEIDGIDISTLGLEDLRSHLAIIPQEPVMFKGTVRSNLDPFHKFSDDDLWKALQLSHLEQAVASFPGKLIAEVAENGDNFSLGQKQLFCLARAILNKSKVGTRLSFAILSFVILPFAIPSHPLCPSHRAPPLQILVLDEATSAMDLESDALIRHTVARVFADRTVITIAHRLDTIIHSDRILVLEAGQVLEFDTPVNLLDNPNSSFSKLVEQTGTSAPALQAAAREGSKVPLDNVQKAEQAALQRLTTPANQAQQQSQQQQHQQQQYLSHDVSVRAPQQVFASPVATEYFQTL